MLRSLVGSEMCIRDRVIFSQVIAGFEPWTSSTEAWHLSHLSSPSDALGLTTVLGQEDPLKWSDGAAKVGLLEIVAGAVVGSEGQTPLALVALGTRGPWANVIDGARGVSVEHPQTDPGLLARQRIALLRREEKNMFGVLFWGKTTVLRSSKFQENMPPARRGRGEKK